jgi:hypothetical protein
MALKQVYLLHHISAIHLSNIGQISEKNICYSMVLSVNVCQSNASEHLTKWLDHLEQKMAPS